MRPMGPSAVVEVLQGFQDCGISSCSNGPFQRPSHTVFVCPR